MDGLVLTHGARSDRDAPLLIAVADKFAAAGYLVRRVNLAFRAAREKGPPRRGGAPRDREGLRLAVEEMRAEVGGRVLLGGASYGGRQSSILASENPGLVDGLLLLSYPLHPPGKPDSLRTEHFPELSTPVLIVQGTRDPFGSIEELEQARQLIPAMTKLITVLGAGHDLKKGEGLDIAPVVSFFGPDQPADAEDHRDAQQNGRRHGPD
jgi:hypothetical protein